MKKVRVHLIFIYHFKKNILYLFYLHLFEFDIYFIFKMKLRAEAGPL